MENDTFCGILWKMTYFSPTMENATMESVTMESVTMESVTMENVTMEKVVVPFEHLKLPFKIYVTEDPVAGFNFLSTAITSR